MVIRNRVFFCLAVLAAAGGALSRHAAAVDGWLGRELLAGLPAPAWFVGAAAALVALSLVPFGRAGRGSEPVDARRLFVKDDPAAIAARLQALTSGGAIDIPLVVDYAIFQAIAAEASDIHFEPRRDGYAVRYRVQGMMADIAALPATVTAPLANRLKVLSNLVIYRGALPQDGRIRETAGDPRKAALERSGLADADFRIAFMPTLHGERIVIRILGRGGDHLDLAELGMADLDRRLLTRLLEQPQGMIILTGPTGSGKTTTIYSCLREIRILAGSRRSTATLEDPIEIDLEGVSQSQVDEGRGYTFDKGLRALLRQDPDVIMVGETRDPETAQAAIRAALTGHLVFSTLHTNDAAGAVSRLLDMGIEPFLVASSVEGLIAQRLVRVLCGECKATFTPGPEILARLKGNRLDSVGADFMRSTGCERCRYTGFRGRTAIYEIIKVDEELKQMIVARRPSNEIKQSALGAGMRTIREDGWIKVRAGITTIDEVLRVTMEDEFGGAAYEGA